MNTKTVREISRLYRLEDVAESYRTEDASELRLKRVENLADGVAAKLMAIGSHIPTLNPFDNKG
jgi:hypothetical protein